MNPSVSVVIRAKNEARFIGETLEAIFTPEAVRHAYELLTSGKIPANNLISDTYPLAQLTHAFDLLQRGEGIKYAVVP